ncbi:MAG TPA: hypothetical protein VFB22_01265 [Candidatus Baltobacteraceae bacterium]|nr:hypothetical protein [Candidatus Baltobacteraceae bacterium]
MTLEQWAGRLDALARAEQLAIPAHGTNERGYPDWSAGGRGAWVRVAEDDATLRMFFVPRDPADTALADEERSHEKTYVRSDVGAREAARDLARFLRGAQAAQ